MNEPSRKTEYLVLERDPERPGSYDVIGKTQAHGPVQAVKLLTGNRDLPEESTIEQFVGVPVSNWTPVGKSVERTAPVVKYAALDPEVVPVVLAAVPEPVEEHDGDAEPGADEPEEEVQTG